MRVIDYFTIAYLVAAILTAGYAFSKLRNPWFYRLIVSCIVGAFWPIPACILVFLWIEGIITDIANWIQNRF